MCDPPTAANDPIFYLHHANIDRLWKRWLDQGGGRQNPLNDTTWMNTAFGFFDEKGLQVQLSGKDILDTVGQLNYCYADDRLCVHLTQPPVERTHLSPTQPQLTVKLIIQHPDHNHLRLLNVKVDGVTVLADSNGGTTGRRPINPGVHTISQTGGTGTSLGAFFTVIGGDCDANGRVSVAQGESKTCSITNFDNSGGCTGNKRCCEPGTNTQGCRVCVGPGQQCQ